MREYIVYIKCKKYIDAHNHSEACEKAYEELEVVEREVDDFEIEEVVQV
jgi:hypothetical protein